MTVRCTMADADSVCHGGQQLWFIEVKGRVRGASSTATVNENEILAPLNKPDDFVLAVVEFPG